MSSKVIQGYFIGGRPRIAVPVAQPKLMPRPPGPPAPAFAGPRPVAQAHGVGDEFQVDVARLGLASSGGRPLRDAIRSQMEAALGADFSNVRVHVGPQAERIGAIAFTLGSDIYFAPGRYQPDTVQGQQVLGHELAHVLQQRAGRVRNPMGTGVAVVQDRVLEAEADRLGHRAAAHHVVAQPMLPPGGVQAAMSVRISAPIPSGRGSYRLAAGAGGRQVGSVMVHTRDRGTVEVTDLGVDPAHREHGIGKMLLDSAARTAQQIGKSHMTLAAQDNGSGHLTRWYKEMGFTQKGVNRRGYPQLEAPIGRLLAAVAQRQQPPGGILGILSQASPFHRVNGRSQSNVSNRFSEAIQTKSSASSIGLSRNTLGGGIVPGATIQRADLEMEDLWPEMKDLWPQQITLKSGMILRRKPKDKQILYENEVHSGHAGSFHISIHFNGPPMDLVLWSPADVPLEGRYYFSKHKNVGTVIDDAGGTAKLKGQYSPDEQEHVEIALGYTREVFQALKPKRDADLYRTTAHKGTIFFNN